jgi:hypothetical protein
MGFTCYPMFGKHAWKTFILHVFPLHIFINLGLLTFILRRFKIAFSYYVLKNYVSMMKVFNLD